MKKSELTELIKSELSELMKFANADALEKYKAKHKMRDTTKVQVGDTETTAGDATDSKASDAKITKKPGDTKQISSAGGNNVLIAKKTEIHIARHNQPGEGSTFGKDINLTDIQNAIKDIPEEFFEKGGGVYNTKVPNAGHNLVQKSSDILKNHPNAKKVMINKQVGFDKKKKEPIMKAVPGYVVDADIDNFKTDQLSIVVRPSNANFMDDELKNDPGVKKDLKGGKSHSVLTSFPGDPNVPTVDKWEDSDHAIIIPNGGEGADKSNWVTDSDDNPNENYNLKTLKLKDLIRK